MRPIQTFSTILLLAVSSLSATFAAQSGPPPPPGCPKDLAAARDQLAKDQEKLNDWAQLKRYQADNAMLSPPVAGDKRVVFYGDSITDAWGRRENTGEFFPGKSYINRGISGQTTPQMLVRFEQDVVRLHPAVVLILAGTNDIAGNTGPSTPQMTEDNFAAMAAIAKQNGIQVVLASITPAYNYPWKQGVEPVPVIREINGWLQDYAAREHLVYLDYYSAMVDEKGAMKPGLSSDGVHPTAQGYAVMAPLAEAAIAQALERQARPKTP